MLKDTPCCDNPVFKEFIENPFIKYHWIFPRYQALALIPLGNHLEPLSYWFVVCGWLRFAGVIVWQKFVEVFLLVSFLQLKIPCQLYFSKQRLYRGKHKHKNPSGDLPGGPVVKNLPSKTGDTGFIPGGGAKIPHATGQLSPSTTTTDPTLESPCPVTREAHALQEDPA